MMELSEKPQAEWQVVAVVIFYMAAAILMVTVNKWVLLATQLPVFFIFCQLVIAVILLTICHYARLISVPRFDRTIAIRLIPLTIINVLGFIFNNLCIQYVDASFYQVARGLILPMTVGLAFATNSTPPSAQCLACCAIITMGFVIGVLYDSHSSSGVLDTSSLGITFGVLSSLTTAVHAIAVRKSLPIVGNSTIHLSWYSNLLTAFGLLPVVLILGEAKPIAEMLVNPLQLRTFLWGTCITGVVGFLISVAGLLSIKMTSPVSHMVSSALRGVLQTGLSVWLFSEIISGPRIASILVILIGSCLYIWTKHVEQEDRQSGHLLSKPTLPQYQSFMSEKEKLKE